MKRLFILLLICCYNGLQGQEPNILTPDDVARIQEAKQVLITPDGEHIFYTITVPADPRAENALPATELYRYDTDSGVSIALINEKAIANLALRPKHNTLSFTARPGNRKNTAIYELSIEGDYLSMIASYKTSIASYTWSPDGTTILFTAPEHPNQPKPELPYQPEIFEEDLKRNAAYTLEVASGAVNILPIAGHVTAVNWSLSGDQIALLAAPSSLIDDIYTSQKIYFLNPENYTVSSEIDHTGKKGEMTWAPDGTRLAFIAGADKHDPIAGRLFLASGKDSKPVLMTAAMGMTFEKLHWKDNNSLWFSASKGVGTILGEMKNGGTISPIIQSDQLAIQDFSIAANGSLAFIANSPEHPNEVFLIEKGSKSPKKITDLNPWLQEKELGTQEVITYKAADGLEIEGLLINPVKQTGLTPMITVVHGGPESHFNNGWLTTYSRPGQMAAGKGYAVFYPNYRGSTGRGLEFAMSSQGDPAGKEFDDIIDGIDHLIETRNIDKSKVGVTGGSYGGYATAWMATRHTDRFAAGVMSVGISNNLSKWGTSDIPEEMFLVHSRKRIWDDYEFFLKRSPIYYADQAKTPLLIMHGKNDTRVDPGQSYELYRHIKTRTDTPVRMVLYPGEGHGNRKSTARYDFSLRMLQWFDHYLIENKKQLPSMKEELLFKN
ncbi:S9 family peptidase [Robertkochia marina]|uniref:S9 family peptidase n=1 Tax=Robertkochia marina TaxID=1227945 RepID=A0A4S3M384_9FLAO|nr:S9 family peptidase [Robertkochia marina]THD69604.1 S9 family peptidase [Robertkochia marina]TRZ47141.1 S9 family peptidase [Robertkochia marina]